VVACCWVQLKAKRETGTKIKAFFIAPPRN
jgi:hypothetical protein